MYRIDVNEKKLSIIAFIIGALVYLNLYWGIYKLIIDKFFNSSIALLNIVDLIVLFVFILSVVPCSFGIKTLLIKFLKK